MAKGRDLRHGLMAYGALAVLLHLSESLLAGCGGGSAAAPPPPPPPLPPVVVTITGASSVMNTGNSRVFSASVSNTANQNVIWSIVEAAGGSIAQDGTYTAPSLPGTFTVKAISQANPSDSATVSVPVVIPVGHIAGYNVGVDYHSTGTDFIHTDFITGYNDPAVRQQVVMQLQGMADRGGTFISTRIWFVTEPGTTNFGEAWRATFPMTAQEEANLHAYAQDVASIQGSGGNRLRLDVCTLWLGAADYTRGDPVNGLGWTPISATEFTSRVEETTDKVLNAVTNVLRPDGVPVVDTIYLEGEVMIGAKANQDWFLINHYPRFVSRVSAAGFKPAVYFITAASEAEVLDNTFVDATYPALNGHRSMFWIYRSLFFMAQQSMYIPTRIDFSCYMTSTGTAYSDLLTRILDDADATLPGLGAPKLYGAAETYYLADAAQRRQFGLAFAGAAAANQRFQRVSFWTTPDGGSPGVNIAYPFAIEDYYPPPN
jgi:hypothetical protein